LRINRKSYAISIGAKINDLQYTPSPIMALNKKAQQSLTNPRDAKACQKLLQFDVLTTLSLTIMAYLHSFSCCCVRNLRNPAKFTENSNLWSSRSSKVIDLGVNRKPMYDFLLVTNSNFNRIWTFVDLENAFDRVPREVLYWSLRRKGISENLRELSGQCMMEQ